MLKGIKTQMDKLGWSVVDLHNETDIDIAVLQDILDGRVKPSYNDVMLIVIAFTKQYPSDEHWDIYHSIMVSPMLRGGK
tara:strand:- start:1043 stop:1279 length:237 start_codon:yes stop_codon:yes gene_type:complete